MTDTFAAAAVAAVETADRKLSVFRGLNYSYLEQLHALILRRSSQTANCHTQIFVYAENDFVLNETEAPQASGEGGRQKWLLNTRQNKHSCI
jgi:hypothetical protein